MKKIQNTSMGKFEQAKNIIMQDGQKLPKLDLSKLKQIPDEVQIGSKIYKYDPEVETYERIVKEGTGDIIKQIKNRLNK